MAKRVLPGEKPYSPITDGLIDEIRNPQEIQAFEEGQGSDVKEQAPTREHRGPQNVVPFKREPEPEAKKEEKEERPREKRTLLSDEEDYEVERLIRSMAKELRTPVKFTNVSRALILLLLDSKEELLTICRNASNPAKFKRPLNGKHALLKHFEHELARIIQTALKNTRTMR